MQLLINDLLKFSRHTQAKEDFIRLDLNKVLQDVLSDLESEIEKKSGKVQVANLPSIWGIPSQMQQLFQNLIVNSLKFTRPTVDPLISIYSEPQVATINGRQRKVCNIFFKDNGIGFDPKYADEIFVVFKRLHSYHEFEGSGIGLSICKKIVEKHNGSIKAEGKLDGGATFVITLPQEQVLMTSI